MDRDGRDQLVVFLQRRFPQALPLSQYGPFDQAAAVSFELGADLAAPPGKALDVLADRAIQVYERVFAPEDRGWVCIVLHGALQAELPPHLSIDDATIGDRIDLDALVPRPVRPPLSGGLDVLVDALPASARRSVSVVHGSDPIEDPALVELYEADSLPYVEVVVRVRPRDIDHGALLRAVVNQDFPGGRRRRLVGTLVVVNEDRPAVFDLPDDRYCGVAMPEAAALRDVYESGLAPLNDYRRSEMQGVFGFWPEQRVPAIRRSRLPRWLRRL